MTYRVHEIFYTLQGEGTHTGRPAVFLRFSGCNLWTGREQDRKTAICQFCDTDFFSFHKYPTPHELAEAVHSLLPNHAGTWRTPMVVCTGGEPMLQLDKQLADALHALPMYISLETNGTQPIPFYIDWVCCSPKAGTKLAITEADEVKLVYPQEGLTPSQAIRRIKAKSYRLQPMDGPNLAENTKLAIEYVLAHPRWSLSLQTHKMVGLR